MCPVPSLRSPGMTIPDGCATTTFHLSGNERVPSNAPIILELHSKTLRAICKPTGLTSSFASWRQYRSPLGLLPSREETTAENDSLLLACQVIEDPLKIILNH